MTKTKQKQVPWTKVLIVTVLFTAPFISGGLYKVYKVLAPFFSSGSTELTGIDWKSLLDQWAQNALGADLRRD